MARRLLAAVPELGVAGAFALIDSPRWPRDLDLAMRAPGARLRHGCEQTCASRAIDIALRAIVRELALKKRDGSPFRLALFPTPKLEFFSACASDPRCKPHLAAIARELFGPALECAPAMSAPAGGRVFTRFMLTGFAAYRALEPTPSASFEAYPDLAFRIWARSIEIPPKRAGRPALDARKRINRRLADEVGWYRGVRDLHARSGRCGGTGAERWTRRAGGRNRDNRAAGRRALCARFGSVSRLDQV